MHDAPLCNAMPLDGDRESKRQAAAVASTSQIDKRPADAAMHGAAAMDAAWPATPPHQLFKPLECLPTDAELQ